MYGQHYYLMILGTVVDTHRLNYSSLTSSILQSLVTHQQFERNTYTTQVSKQRTPGGQGHFLLRAI